MKRVIISSEPISAEVALAGLADLGGGAVSSFIGSLRVIEKTSQEEFA